MYDILKGAFWAMMCFVGTYFVLMLAFPHCDQRAKNVALARYNQRMQEAGLPIMDIDDLSRNNKVYNYNIGVEAAVQLQRELKACHCDGSNPVERFKKDVILE